jgi:hypothetical protein
MADTTARAILALINENLALRLLLALHDPKYGAMRGAQGPQANREGGST